MNIKSVSENIFEINCKEFSSQNFKFTNSNHKINIVNDSYKSLLSKGKMLKLTDRIAQN
jgi:hypothetical protein